MKVRQLACFGILIATQSVSAHNSMIESLFNGIFELSEAPPVGKPKATLYETLNNFIDLIFQTDAYKSKKYD